MHGRRSCFQFCSRVRRGLLFIVEVLDCRTRQPLNVAFLFLIACLLFICDLLNYGTFLRLRSLLRLIVDALELVAGWLVVLVVLGF